MVGAGAAFAQLPRTQNVPHDQIVWVGLNPDCGCVWAWSPQLADLSDRYESELWLAGDVEAGFDHTGLHHLLPEGFSPTHLPVPGHAH